ncbi:hypothetical protein [Hafnia paralvei]|uniref:hypothetical protein n=1 Tax=Hafnia paralvei TaxID=546367 RepID=UPI001F22CDCF|nr:hypothetical protein [Hafnia paralvei]MCE9950365.1 hypothetical protein [Hafnia paralvei]
MTSREQFEAWCTKRGLSTDTDSDCWGQQKYKYDRIQCMWEGWQASREAVELEIDNHTEFEIEHMICPDKDGYSVGWIDGRNYAVKQVRAAGIKVKGE